MQREPLAALPLVMTVCDTARSRAAARNRQM